jgi:hypothetical protein
MKFYTPEGYAVEVNKQDVIDWLTPIINKVTGFFASLKEKRSRKKLRRLTVGLRIASTGFVYQRGVVELNLNQLETELLQRDSRTTVTIATKFRRPMITDLFSPEYIKEVTPEKGYDEPEDDCCDIYITI